MNYSEEELKTALEVQKQIMEKGTPTELKSVFAAGLIVGNHEKKLDVNADMIVDAIIKWANYINLSSGFDNDLDLLYKMIYKRFGNEAYKHLP